MSRSNLAIKVQVNLPRLLENLGHAFSNSLTVVSELLQNARRAGATKVTVQFDKDSKTLVVTDDGCGITDFQNLLTIAESGWDQEIKEVECPYGMGFLASLYACEHIEAASVCGTVSFDTRHALQFGEIPVATGDPIKNGTIISLRGFKDDVSDPMMEQTVKGFPLPIQFNGVELPRPYALANITSVETSIGHLCIQGIHMGNPSSFESDTAAYLLGFKVYPDHNNISGNNIIHLDPRKFHARMPDRDCLVDEDKATKKIRVEVTRLWRQILEEKARELQVEEFLDVYAKATLYFHKELLNSIPVLPSIITTRMDQTPNQSKNWENSGFLHVSKVTRDQVESGEVILCDDINYVYDETVEAAMFAYLGKFTMVEACRLDDNHWAMPYVRRLEEEEFEIAVTGEKATGSYTGSWTGGDVVVCESYTINVKEESLTCEHGPRTVTGYKEPIYSAVKSRGAFVFPGESSDGSVVLQACNYEDEWETVNDHDLSQDSSELTRVVRQLRGASPQDILKSILLDIDWRNYNALKGRTFTIGFSEKGIIHVEEVEDAFRD